MKNKRDALHILVFAEGYFQGYIRSISEAKNKIETTYNVYEALAYAKREVAQKAIVKATNITKGTLNFNIE